MNKFDSLDSFSYQCGVIDAFNEVVKAGVKRIALMIRPIRWLSARR